MTPLDEGDTVLTSLLVDACSTESIQKLCFPEDFSVQRALQGREDDSILGILQQESVRAIPTAITQAREGRSKQRWDKSGTVRLVAGTVPILSDGSVLLASSSRRRDWILPKGGWELDETLEAAALRETFEEAGVSGFLGPPLESRCIETGKARRRRMHHHSPASVREVGSRQPVDDNCLPGADGDPESEDCHTHVQLALFPLYVTVVKDEWPESTRLRRVTDLDSAIEAVAHKPAFQSALLEVRSRRLNMIDWPVQCDSNMAVHGS